MKTFLLVCQVFYGMEEPKFTPQEWALLDGCQKVYTELKVCQAAETTAKQVKHPEVYIITSCSLQG